MKMIVAALVVAFASTLAACSAPDATAYTTVDQMYAAIQRNDAVAGAAMMEPAQQASMRAGIAELSHMIPQGAPISSANAGWNISVNSGQPRQTTVTREYTYPDRVVTARAILIDGPGQPRWLVRGFDINSRFTGAGAASGGQTAPQTPATSTTPTSDAGPAPSAGSGSTASADAGSASGETHAGDAAASNSGSPVEGQ